MINFSIFAKKLCMTAFPHLLHSWDLSLAQTPSFYTVWFLWVQHSLIYTASIALNLHFEASDVAKVELLVREFPHSLFLWQFACINALMFSLTKNVFNILFHVSHICGASSSNCLLCYRNWSQLKNWSHISPEFFILENCNLFQLYEQ